MCTPRFVLPLHSQVRAQLAPRRSSTSFKFDASNVGSKWTSGVRGEGPGRLTFWHHELFGDNYLTFSALTGGHCTLCSLQHASSADCHSSFFFSFFFFSFFSSCPASEFKTFDTCLLSPHHMPGQLLFETPICTVRHTSDPESRGRPQSTPSVTSIPNPKSLGLFTAPRTVSQSQCELTMYSLPTTSPQSACVPHIPRKQRAGGAQLRTTEK
jgi:hypothetical protein